MKYKNASASTLVKTGRGEIAGIVVSSTSSGTLRLNDGLTTTTAAAVKATQTLTTTDVFSDGEIITVGNPSGDTIVYTMRTALSSPAVANEVLIGASAAASLDNLKSAVNGSAGEGTTYSTGTVANPIVTATTNTNTTQVLEATNTGTDSNAITTTTDAANATFGAGTLAGGTNGNFLMLNTITPAAGANIIFPEPVEFTNGLYVTAANTIDFMVIYK